VENILIDNIEFMRNVHVHYHPVESPACQSTRQTQDTLTKKRRK